MGYSSESKFKHFEGDNRCTSNDIRSPLTTLLLNGPIRITVTYIEYIPMPFFEGFTPQIKRKRAGHLDGGGIRVEWRRVSKGRGVGGEIATINHTKKSSR